MTRWPKIAAPLAALALLTGACGTLQRDDPVPSVSPPGSPGLKRVWQLPRDASFTAVAGNTVVIDGGAFADATTGRVLGEPDLRPVASDARTTIDERGRPLVVIDSELEDEQKSPYHRESVYRPNGRFVWGARTDDTHYAGGYVAQPRRPDGQLVIRTPSGRRVAHLPAPDYRPWNFRIDGPNPAPTRGSFPELHAVRPGLLVASGIGEGSSQAALVDVSQPGPARVRMLRPSGDAVQVAVGRRGAYVYWPSTDDSGEIALYDGSSARPVWHRHGPPGAEGASLDFDDFPELNVFPGRNGEDDTVVLTDRLTDPANMSWFFHPDTGAPIDAAYTPPDRFVGRPVGAAGGRVYFRLSDTHDADDGDEQPDYTQTIDLRDGSLRTINAPLDGVAPSGNLIAGVHQITAYRWN